MQEDLLEYDRQHIWHPYTSATKPLPVYEVTSAHGCRLTLADGRELVDGMSSWWAAIHGYNHPTLNDAINQQVAKMSHIMFGGITHQPAVDLAKKLVDITPEPLQWVFFCDSGSVSVEVSMKMALQYQASIGQKQRTKFATIRGGYHGDTWHAMSVCDPETGMHHIFNGSLPIHHFATRPQIAFGDVWDDADFATMQQLIDLHHNELAAIIIEPIVQGAGGMWFYHPEYLKKLRKACTDRGILLIADEIATGFGRTGKLFACEHAGISPDIMCLGKAITGGYMTFAATLTTRQVAEGISQGEAGVFMHGPTFMGNPLACAVANASIDLLLSSPWQQTVKNIEMQLLEGLSPLKKSDKVMNVRCLGAIGVVELQQPVDMAVIQKMFVDRGVWVRPFGRLVYLMPPFVISQAELQQLIDTVTDITTIL
jgi:adenosylmethionine-8-amino-7-oxononanoate aminotransferase